MTQTYKLTLTHMSTPSDWEREDEYEEDPEVAMWRAAEEELVSEPSTWSLADRLVESEAGEVEDPKPKGRVKQGLRFCFTWFLEAEQAEEEYELIRINFKELVEQEKLKYVCGGLEKAPSTGRWHIQGYCEARQGAKQMTYKQMLDIVQMEESSIRNPRPSFQAARGSAPENKAYCFGLVDGKEENDQKFEYGTPRPPRAAKSGGEGKRPKVDYETQLDLIREGKLHDTEARLQICHFGNMLKINFSYPRGLTELDKLENEWVWGPPGVGKSTYARKKGADSQLGVYVKDAQTKWWDGYAHQGFVIIDDLEKEAKYMLHMLKMVGDHYPTRVEIKGAYTEIRPKHVIVTSNYSIDEVFEDEQARAAIKRRYKLTHMTSVGTTL